MNRSKKILRNVITTFAVSGSTLVTGLIVQYFFARTLGATYMGLNTLFGNIVSMLTLADLGISAAITYHLYRTLKENDKALTMAIMQYYKRKCHLIVGVIIVVGICLMPFLGAIANDAPENANLQIIFGLFLINTVFSYLLVYRRVLLQANQEEYILNNIHIGYVIGVSILQVAALILTGNYILFLIIAIIGKVVENIAATIFINKKYPFIKNNNAKTKLPAPIRKDLNRRVKASIFHNIGSQVVTNTDNLIITNIFGLAVVGVYSNYNLVLRSLNELFGKIFSATTASLASLILDGNKWHTSKTVDALLFTNSWLFSWVSITAYFAITPFIELWMGTDFLLTNLVVITLVVNFYCHANRRGIGAVHDAVGVLHEDRFVPLIESAINLVASLVLAHFFGLAGIFMGTVISNLFLHYYSYPKYVFKGALKRSPLDYIIPFTRRLFLFGIVWVAIAGLMYVLRISSLPLFVQLMVNVAIPTVLVNLIYFIIYRKTPYFARIKETAVSSLRSKRKKQEG